MKLGRLLEQHRKFESQGLPGSFGDGYLIVHNRVFKNIREAALSAGFQFSSDRDEAYDSFPLLRLEALLEKKTLPYAKNTAALTLLSGPQIEALAWEDLDGNLKKNFVFHEACHGVIRELAKKHAAIPPRSDDLESQRGVALRMLLEESCSNTAEFLGSIEAADPVHRIFYEMNSYVCEFEERTHFKNAAAKMGESFLARFMILAYLQSNFLRERVEERDFQEMLKIAEAPALDTKDQKTLRAFLKIAFRLSERFRYQTTGFHLRLAGIKTPMPDLFDFDILKKFSSHKGSRELLFAVAEVFCR